MGGMTGGIRGAQIARNPFVQRILRKATGGMRDFQGKSGSASIWVVIPVPFHATIEEFCSQDIGICPVEHAPLNCFGFIDSPLQ